MKPSFWNRWWFWPAVAIGIATVIGAASLILCPNWGYQFSANLFAGLVVAVAVGVVVVGWLERTRKKQELGERTAKVLAALDRELRCNLKWVVKYLDVLGRGGGPIEDELNVSGWRAIAAGPLLDAVPEGLLPYLLQAYPLTENAKEMIRLHLDLLLTSRATPSQETTDQLGDVRALLLRRFNEIKPLMEIALDLIEPYLESEQKQSSPQ